MSGLNSARGRKLTTPRLKPGTRVGGNSTKALRPSVGGRGPSPISTPRRSGAKTPGAAAILRSASNGSVSVPSSKLDADSGAEVADGKSTPRHTVAFPTPTDRPAPSKPSAVSDEHSVERRMLADMLGGVGGGSSGSSSARSKGKGDDSMGGLMGQMANKLGRVERAARSMRDELVRKDREILALKRKVETLQAASSGADIGRADEFSALKSENDSLRQQVHDMETFLNDYGLVWLGEDSKKPSLVPDIPKAPVEPQEGPGRMLGGGDPAPPLSARVHSSRSTEGKMSDEGSTVSGREGVVKTDHGLKVHFGVLEQKVKVLNSMAGEGKAKIVAEKGAHRLRMPDGINITIYKNGIMPRRGPFLPYSDKRAQEFITDILDGYFPMMFKGEYPEGVVLKLIDKTAGDYLVDGAVPFQGRGKAVGAKIKGLADVGNTDFVLGRTEFLNALPEKVIKSGKVIDIRAGIAAKLAGGDGKQADVVVVDTPAVESMGEDMDKTITGHDVTTIRVKSGSGTQTLIIKLRFTDTIGDLRKAIDKNRVERSAYELRTAFPAMSYPDESVTLEDAGLTPNANMMLRVL